MHNQLVEGAMLEALVLDFDFPASIAALHALHSIAGAFGPLVEVAHNIDFGGVGSPFAQHIAFFGLVQTEIEIAGGKFAEVVCTIGKFCHLAYCLVMTPVDSIGKISQSAVVPDDF